MHQELAEGVAGVDLIVGGHNHFRLDPPVEDKGVLILQAGERGAYLGRLDLEVEGDRLLFAGRGSARREMSWGLSDANALLGFASGKQLPRGAIWRWLWRRQRRH